MIDELAEMDITSSSAAVRTLDNAGQELHSLLRDSETEIATVTAEFQELAHHTDAILHLAAGVIGGIENESVTSILPNVQVLGAMATQFIQDKVHEVHQILDTVKTEAALLDRLSQLTQGQRSIARETHTLSVLTKIEVARLGQIGSGFEYLAHQLDDFSQSVDESTADLAYHTNEQRHAIQETLRALGIELPRIQEEFAKIDSELGAALTETDSSLREFFQAPAQLRYCVTDLASQIIGVVTAVQSHDITRQQIEHVQEAMQLISESFPQQDGPQNELAGKPSMIIGGLSIQIYQLKSIQETVSTWVSQIGKCMDAIQSISSAELKGIGPMVLVQEQQLSQQLGRIEAMQQRCQADAERIESALTGLSTLTLLVGEHLARSKSVRDRIQLLTFNSIIESSRLGAKADAILEISQSIKRISAAWSELTSRSGHANEEILSLVEQARVGINGSSGDRLREAQVGIAAGLEGLRAAATYTADQAPEIEILVGRLQAKIVEVSAARDRLDACFARTGTVLCELEELKRQYAVNSPVALSENDQRNVESVFSASYTTEIEREVLRAALLGAPLPTAQQNLAGNDVELF